MSSWEVSVAMGFLAEPRVGYSEFEVRGGGSRGLPSGRVANGSGGIESLSGALVNAEDMAGQYSR
jgi:hypothetical protein